MMQAWQAIKMAGELWLIRHGETAWSLSGQHTGRTDIALTAAGAQQAAALGQRLAAGKFALVLSSPLRRARRTCELVGLGGAMQIEPNLAEWDYGDYEGRTSAEIQQDRPGWTIFADGVPGGESLAQVAGRAEAVIARAVEASAGGDVALFGHGHILRVLAACWLGLPARDGRCFALAPAAVSTLGYEHSERVMTRWNLS